MRFYLLLLFFLSLFGTSVQGQITLSLFDSLYKMEEVKIILTYPYDSLYRLKRDEIDATISIETKRGTLMKDTPITLNLRGKFRRMKCTMPPLMLNFKKSTLEKLHLEKVDEIKLVTHCITGKEGQENLQEERMCYQLYEKLTPFAFRTIWLTVEYHDFSSTGKVITSSGFLLEPDKDLAQRMGFTEKKVYNISEDSLHFETYSYAVAFNFLIGNRDWGVSSARNVKMFYDSIHHHYIVVPYDFDFANIVGASYRRDVSTEGIGHPFDRKYEGEYFKDQAGNILKSFLSQENVITTRLFEAENPLEAGRRKKISAYFEDWFQTIRKGNPLQMGYGIVFPYKGNL